jgi:hypothetical protein
MSKENEKKKAWWEILSALTPLIVGICVTGVGGYFTYVHNNRQLQLNQIKVLDKFKPQLISENAYEREFAYASFTAFGYEDLALKLMKAQQDAAGRSVAQQIQLSGTVAAKSEAKATLSLLPIQVYIQIANEKQRVKAESIRVILQEKGYVVHGIENVVGKLDFPRKPNVRYFNNQDKPIADGIVAILIEQGLSSAYSEQVSRYKVKPGSLEIWFSPDAY